MRPHRLLAAVIGIALGAVLIAISQPARIWSSLQLVDPIAVVAVLLLNAAVILLRAYRAQLLLHYLGYRVGMLAMLPVMLIGQTSSTLTPAAGGDFMRAYLWRSRTQVPLRVGAAVVSFERLFSLFLLIVVSILLIALPRHGIAGWVGVAVGLAVATVAPMLLDQLPVTLERRVLGWLSRIRFLDRFSEGAIGAVEQFRRLSRSSLLLSASSVVTLAIFSLSGVQVWLVIAGLDHRVPMTQAVAAYTTSQVIGILSTLPFGIGAADVALVTLFAGYGVTLSLAATTAVLLRAAVTIPQALAGLLAYVASARSRAATVAEPQ